MTKSSKKTNLEYRLAHDRDRAIYNVFGGTAMPATAIIESEPLG